MEKEKILEIFGKNGLMIEPRALEFFTQNPNYIENFLEKLREVKNTPIIITFDFVKKILEEKKIEIEEIKKKVVEKKTFSIGDVSNFLIERYEKIKSFFSYRLDLVNLISINKIGEKTKKFSLIVMIRDIDKESKTILVEDLTGEISLKISDELMKLLVQDEVVGLLCEKLNGEIIVTNIFWPDIPLKKTIGKLEEEICCLFASRNVFDENSEDMLKEIKKLNFKFLYIFLFLDKDWKKEKIEEFKKELPLNSKLILISESRNEVNDVLIFSSPAFLILEKKIILLLVEGKIFSLYKNLGKDVGEIMLNLLKKRHLNPTFKMENLFLEENFLIDPVPDIFVSANFDSPSLINYKGTTIISCGSSEKLFWIVNLKSRESLKISLT